ncbi:MAG: cbb3-type cytochrome oxidase assembly protein CcoS [Nitrospirae bacterium]|nr:MAG: cbb3-type cytochrome oxidase assembly protein CcoS [Nitrospirota bacterium]
MTSLIPLIGLSLCLGVGFLMIFLWALRTGQFDDPEGPKYRMLFDDDESEVFEEPEEEGERAGGP